MKYKIKKDLILDKKGSKVTIFDPDRSILIELNEVASFIFYKIKKGLDEREIFNALKKIYHIKKSVLFGDISNSIMIFKKNKIIF